MNENLNGGQKGPDKDNNNKKPQPIMLFVLFALIAMFVTNLLYSNILSGSKEAITYTKFLASHYGEKNVRCNVLNLGGFFNGQPKKFVERYSAKTFLGRMANETDVKGAVVFLASEASAYITGTGITIDGGYCEK